MPTRVPTRVPRAKRARARAEGSVLEHAMVCGDLLVKLACASTQTALELVEEHGVVETFHALLRRHDAPSFPRRRRPLPDLRLRAVVGDGVARGHGRRSRDAAHLRRGPHPAHDAAGDGEGQHPGGRLRRARAGDEARAKKVDLEALLPCSSKEGLQRRGGGCLRRSALYRTCANPAAPAVRSKGQHPAGRAEVMELRLKALVPFASR